MTVLDTSMLLGHALFAGLWVGGTLLMAGYVIPRARDGRLARDAVERSARRFTQFSLAGIVITVLTGGYLTETRYSVDSLLSTGRGHLVLAMVGLWLVLAGLLHFGTHALTEGMESDGPRAGATASQNWFRASGIVGILLLVVAGRL